MKGILVQFMYKAYKEYLILFIFHRWSVRSHAEKAMAPHSSTLAWKIPWTEEPGRLQSMGSLRVEHNWATSLSFFTFMHWRRKWQPIPVFLPGESQGRGSLGAAVYGVAQSRTRLKRLSSSSSRLKHARLLQCSQSRYFSRIPFLSLWSNKCCQFDPWFLCLF